MNLAQLESVRRARLQLLDSTHSDHHRAALELDWALDEAEIPLAPCGVEPNHARAE